MDEKTARRTAVIREVESQLADGELDARAVIAAALATYPDEAWLHYQLGEAHDRQHAIAEAKAAFARARELDPDTYDVLEEDLREYTQILAHDPDASIAVGSTDALPPFTVRVEAPWIVLQRPRQPELRIDARSLDHVRVDDSTLVLATARRQCAVPATGDLDQCAALTGDADDSLRIGRHAAFVADDHVWIHRFRYHLRDVHDCASAGLELAVPGGMAPAALLLLLVDNDESAADFWAWFVEHAPRLNDHLAELQRRIDAVVPDADWEIGPADDECTFFALCPTSGDDDLDDAIRSLIAVAPSVPGWVIRLYKPRRDWDMAFSITVDGREVMIEGAQWSVAVLESTDGWDVTFVCDPRLRTLPEDALHHAATVLLDGELGTQKSRTLVGHMDVQTAPRGDAVPLTSGWLDATIR